MLRIRMGAAHQDVTVIERGREIARVEFNQRDEDHIQGLTLMIERELRKKGQE